MPHSAEQPVTVDAARVQAELDQLATYSSTPAPSVTRILFTETDMAGREYIRSLMREAGLQVIEDAAGNIFGRWQGSDPDAGRVGSGSHCDAIPHAGKFDGTVGVVGGIAAVRALKASGYTPRRSIDIIMFTAEEPTRFGIGCSGSRLMGGALAAQELAALKDEDGVSFEEARIGAGYSGDLASVELGDDDYAYFVELHVEQGPELERLGRDIGVVMAIAAPASFKMHFEGLGGHAGTVLMPDRKDALVPAAIMIALAEELAANSGSPDTVATAGICDVHPGAINSIPRQVTVSFDVRDTDLATRERVANTLKERGESLARERGLGYELELINADPPINADPEIRAAIEASSAAAGLSAHQQVSRAYHDALFVARKVATGMIFIPSKDGISHRPDEYTSPEEVANGVKVLAATLARLAA